MRRLLVLATFAWLTACSGGSGQDTILSDSGSIDGFGSIMPGWPDSGDDASALDSTIIDSGAPEGGDSGADGSSDSVDASDDGTSDGSGGDTLDAGTGDATPEAGDDSATCGKTGTACCPDGSCAGGALCLSGSCGTCGGPGLVCCAGDICSSGSACSGGSCVKCGGIGEACCGGGACSSGFVCAVTGTCAKCGGIGEPCCGGGTCGSGVCSLGTCACGGVGQPCCAGSSCSSGGTCSGGSCTSCGAAGQPCCPGAVCSGGAVCNSGACVATSSCSRQADCTGSLKCGGPSSCAGTPCFTCYAAPGSGGVYAACTASTGCASGVCDDLRGHCSAACALGTTGDTDCTATVGAGSACTEVTYTIGSTSATLGYCNKKCAHDVDCGSDICQGNSNNAYNRLDVTCGPAGTGAARGAICTTSNDCASGVCLTTGATKHCSSFCTGASDCAAPVPNCVSVSFILPKGGTQKQNVCAP